MYKLLGGLKDYLKWQDITTDCAIFRLHTLFTTVLLMAGSLIITASQFVGNPIQCIVNGIPTHVVNTFCWISSTFTMPDAFKRQVIIIADVMVNVRKMRLLLQVGMEVAHPGVANDFNDTDAQKYYTYYQWVCFVLFFQVERRFHNQFVSFLFSPTKVKWYWSELSIFYLSQGIPTVKT